MVDFNQIILAGIEWIKTADEGANDTDLLSLVRRRFPNVVGPVVILHPSTTRVATFFQESFNTGVFFSAGVTNQTAPELIKGWTDIREANEVGANTKSDFDAGRILAHPFVSLDNYGFYLVGHSGGGALVEALVNRIGKRPNPPIVFACTMGAPATLVGGKSVQPRNTQRCRIMNAADPVPGLPFCAATATTAFSWVSASTGANFQPWKFQHPGHGVLINDPAVSGPVVADAPPTSTLPATSELVNWMTGEDGRIGFPHASRTYFSRITEANISEIVSLGNSRPTPAPEPSAPGVRDDLNEPAPDRFRRPLSTEREPEPPRLVMELVQNEEPTGDVVGIPEKGSLEPKPIDISSFGVFISVTGVNPVVPKEFEFSVVSRSGRHFLHYKGNNVREYAVRGTALRTAQRLNSAVRKLVLGDGNPELVTAALLDVLGSTLKR